MSRVDIYTWRLELSERRTAYFWGLLNAAERARAQRLIFEEHRRRWTVARGRLRELLGERLLRDPGQLSFSLGERGKPTVEGIEFNLSHSADLAMLAVSSLEVGLDVEQHRRLTHRERVAERSFSAYEFERYSGLDEPAATQRFFELWTCKEAFIKAVGQGFAYGTRRFDVDTRGGRYRLLRFEDPEETPADWSLVRLTAPEGFSAALACRSMSLEVVEHPEERD